MGWMHEFMARCECGCVYKIKWNRGLKLSVKRFHDNCPSCGKFTQFTVLRYRVNVYEEGTPPPIRGFQEFIENLEI